MAARTRTPPRRRTPRRASDGGGPRRSSARRSPGCVVLRLDVHEDNRGWFKENWQREKMTALGLPDFGPVQNNISFNAARGTTRGIHAEPWDKFVSVATGRVFGAWVDLREGADVRHDVHRRARTRASRSSCRAASATATRRSRTPPRTPTWSTTTGVPAPAYPALNLADPTRRRSPGRSRSDRGRDLREGPRHTRAWPTSTPMPPRRTLDRRRQRPARPRAAAGVPRRRRASTCAELDLTDAGRGRRAGRGTTTTWCSTPRPTPPSTPPRRPTGRRAAWAANATGPAALARLAARARLHARALLHRLRLRRHRRASTPRTSRCRRWASTARPRPPATSPSAAAPRHYMCARRG